MKNKDEKKIRFGGWNTGPYKFSREKIRKFWYEEISNECKLQRTDPTALVVESEDEGEN